MTEEQKEKLYKAQIEIGQKKMEKFDSLTKMVEPTYFNANVFKNVKLVMSGEELKEEEQKVQDLSNYLKENALNNLVNNFQKQDGTPCDSAALSDFFHQNGVNMRYLGQVADLIKDKNMNYMKYILEREVVIRCVKHLMSKYIRECESEELIGATVSHILNCLLAPREFIKRLDDKHIKYNYSNLNQ